jgi:hypothetical protein
MKLSSDSNFDGTNGLHNMDDIIAKVYRMAADFNANDKRKKPFHKHIELRCPSTGKVILRMPLSSASGLRAFRQLNSLSRDITLNALHLRLRNGEDFDGFLVCTKEELLFEEDIGFPDDEA